MSNDAWIAEYIEPNPHYPGIDEARLKGYGVAVWALIGFSQPWVGILHALRRLTMCHEWPLRQPMPTTSAIVPSLMHGSRPIRSRVIRSSTLPSAAWLTSILITTSRLT
jgi:hypothetical protein